MIYSWQPDGFANPIGMEQRIQHERYLEEENRRRMIEEANKRSQEVYQQQMKQQEDMNRAINERIHQQNLANEIERNRQAQNYNLHFNRRF